MATVTDPKLKQEILDLFNQKDKAIEPDISGSEQVTDPELSEELFQIQKDQEEKSKT